MDNVTSHIRYFPSLPRIRLANITVGSYNNFYRMFCPADSLSKPRWPQSRYQHPRAIWQPGYRSSPASAKAGAVRAHGKLKCGSLSTYFEFTFSYTSFMAAKLSMSLRYTLTLTTFSQDDPAASKTSPRLEIHCAYAHVSRLV